MPETYNIILCYNNINTITFFHHAQHFETCTSPYCSICLQLTFYIIKCTFTIMKRKKTVRFFPWAFVVDVSNIDVCAFRKRLFTHKFCRHVLVFFRVYSYKTRFSLILSHPATTTHDPLFRRVFSRETIIVSV